VCAFAAILVAHNRRLSGGGTQCRPYRFSPSQ
jgi:hypothetical protein